MKYSLKGSLSHIFSISEYKCTTEDYLRLMGYLLDMYGENTERNALLYDLWVKGYTVDKATLETGYPRSSVGYYFRKFNKKASKGEPIITQPVVKPDPQTLTRQGIIKASKFSFILELLLAGEHDAVYKHLMILKLVKELQKDIFPTREEEEAFNKVFYQVIQARAEYLKNAQNMNDYFGKPIRNLDYHPKPIVRDLEAEVRLARIRTETNLEGYI